MGGVRGMRSRVQGSERCELLRSKQGASQHSVHCILLHIHLFQHSLLMRVSACIWSSDAVMPSLSNPATPICHPALQLRKYQGSAATTRGRWAMACSSASRRSASGQVQRTTGWAPAAGARARSCARR